MEAKTIHEIVQEVIKEAKSIKPIETEPESEVEEPQPLTSIIKSIEDEFDQEKLKIVFKPIYDIIEDKDKSLKRKLQLMHNAVVALRKEFDNLEYSADVKARNRELNRLKYHKKKGLQTWPFNILD